MKNTIYILLLCSILFSCKTECDNVNNNNLTVLIDATDRALIKNAKDELSQDNFKFLLKKKFDISEESSCFNLKYDFSTITSKNYYNPNSVSLKFTELGKAKNYVSNQWKGFFNQHHLNLSTLDSVQDMKNTCLLPTVIKAINKSSGTVLLISDGLENNLAFNFYRSQPTTKKQMEIAYQKIVKFYMPDEVSSSNTSEIYFLIVYDEKYESLIPKAKAFWRYVFTEHLKVKVTFIDGISTI